jgi:hypothetical protein
MIFHLKKVHEWARYHGLEVDLDSGVAEERAFTPPRLSRCSTLPRQQRSQPELRDFVREGSVVEAPGRFVTPRRPMLRSGHSYEPSSSPSRYSDGVLPPDTPSALRRDSPLIAREKMATPSTFKKVVQVCIQS